MPKPLILKALPFDEDAEPEKLAKFDKVTGKLKFSARVTATQRKHLNDSLAALNSLLRQGRVVVAKGKNRSGGVRYKLVR